MAIRFRNRSLGSITASNNAIPNRWAGVFRIMFENMVVEFSDHNNCRIVYTKENNREEYVSANEDNALVEEDRYFIDVLLGKRPQFASMQEGLVGLIIVSGACESSDNDGKPVRIER